MRLYRIINIKISYLRSVRRTFLICMCLVLFSGCQKTNAEKIMFIQRNIKKTDNKIIAKQKNQLIVPDFLKNGKIDIDEDAE